MVDITVIGIKETQSLVANLIRNVKTEPIKMIGDMAKFVSRRAREIAKEGPYSRGRGAGYRAIKLSNILYAVEPTAKDARGRIYGGYLEYGTDPHDIPNAFGIPGYGIGGRFDVRFHPGAKGKFPLRKATRQVQKEFPNIYRKCELVKRGTT